MKNKDTYRLSLKQYRYYTQLFFPFFFLNELSWLYSSTYGLDFAIWFNTLLSYHSYDTSRCKFQVTWREKKIVGPDIAAPKTTNCNWPICEIFLYKNDLQALDLLYIVTFKIIILLSSILCHKFVRLFDRTLEIYGESSFEQSKIRGTDMA